MKVLVLNNVLKENHILIEKLKEIYNVPIFEVEKIMYDESGRKLDIDEQNKVYYDIIRTNPDWFFVGYPMTSLDFISSSATSIIFMNYATDVVKRRFRFLSLLQRVPVEKNEVEIPEQYTDSYMREFVKKYARKIIYLKEKNEFKTLLEAIDKRMEL